MPPFAFCIYIYFFFLAYYFLSFPCLNLSLPPLASLQLLFPFLPFPPLPFLSLSFPFLHSISLLISPIPPLHVLPLIYVEGTPIMKGKLRGRLDYLIGPFGDCKTACRAEQRSRRREVAPGTLCRRIPSSWRREVIRSPLVLAHLRRSLFVGGIFLAGWKDRLSREVYVREG